MHPPLRAHIGGVRLGLRAALPMAPGWRVFSKGKAPPDRRDACPMDSLAETLTAAQRSAWDEALPRTILALLAAVGEHAAGAASHPGGKGRKDDAAIDVTDGGGGKRHACAYVAATSANTPSLPSGSRCMNSIMTSLCSSDCPSAPSLSHISPTPAHTNRQKRTSKASMRTSSSRSASTSVNTRLATPPCSSAGLEMHSATSKCRMAVLAVASEPRCPRTASDPSITTAAHRRTQSARAP